MWMLDNLALFEGSRIIGQFLRTEVFHKPIIRTLFIKHGVTQKTVTIGSYVFIAQQTAT